MESMINMLRVLINDNPDSGSYVYTDNRLREILTVASMYTYQEITFILLNKSNNFIYNQYFIFLPWLRTILPRSGPFPKSIQYTVSTHQDFLLLLLILNLTLDLFIT